MIIFLFCERILMLDSQLRLRAALLDVYLSLSCTQIVYTLSRNDIFLTWNTRICQIWLLDCLFRN